MTNSGVIGVINYLVSAESSSPLWYTASSISTTKRSNFLQSPVNVIMHDLRDSDERLDLDINGFELVKYTGSMQEEWKEDCETRAGCYEEISNFLTKHLGASRVVVYDHCFRRRNSTLNDAQRDHQHRDPVFYPHVDIDAAEAQKKVEKMLGEEAAKEAMQHRVQIINVWRPLGSQPITKCPLAICDYSSINPDEDAHQVILYTTQATSTAYTMSRTSEKTHRWCYVSNMKSDEMFLFKIFDNAPDVAQYAFHTAFINESAPSPQMEERSIEFRCLVLYDR